MKEQELRADFEKWYTSEMLIGYSVDDEKFAMRLTEKGYYGDRHAQTSWRGYLAASTPLLERIAELEKDAARYRWLRDHYHGFEQYRSGVVPYVTLDSEVDKQLADQHKEQT